MEAKVAVQVGSRITGRLVAVPVDQGNVRRAQSTLDDLVAGSRPAEIEQLRERANSARATGGSWKCATGS